MKYSYSVPLPKFIEKRRGDKHGSRNREKFSLLRINDTIPFNRIEGQDPMIRILRFRFIVFRSSLLWDAIVKRGATNGTQNLFGKREWRIVFRISRVGTARRNGSRREGKRVNIVESCSRPLTDGVASITYFKIFRREFEHSSWIV